MKTKDNMFAQMRSAASAVRSALQGLHRNTAAPQSAPMRDINHSPDGTAAAGGAASEALKNLMPSLQARLDAAGLGAGLPLDLSGFAMPGLAPVRREAPPALPGQFIDGSYGNGAGTRAFKLYMPGSCAGTQGKSLPLVVMLHGCTQDPDDFALGTRMNALAEEMQCLVLYPAQSQQANVQRCWNWFNGLDQQRDQGEPSILAGMTRQVMEKHAVDPRQVYVAGLSAGGAMAAIMGTLYPDLYAAVGVHSGLPFASAHDLPSALAAMQGKFGRPHQQGTTLPVIVFHGDMDTTVHPVNGDALIAQRAQRACDAMVMEPGRVPNGHAYTRTVHRRADGTALAEQWLIHGAGHAWSGGSTHGSYTDGRGPDASREMLRFFRTAR